MTDEGRSVANEVTDDGRSILPAGSWAALWSAEEGYYLLIPAVIEKAAKVQREAVALTACLARLQRDSDFREEMIAWFQRAKQ